MRIDRTGWRRLAFAAALPLASCGGGLAPTLSQADSGSTAAPATNAPVSSASASASGAPFAAPSTSAAATPSGDSTATASSAPSSAPTGAPTGASVTQGGPLCLPITPTMSLAPPQPLRFGVDPGAAGNLVPVSTESAPSADMSRELDALAGLHPRHGPLVVRLNRLFWSGGEPLLQQFASDEASFARAGYDVEVQVRYHPGPTQIGDLAGWVTYVRHVVDVLGANPGLVALTITNEVNFTVSPNTSDGAYPGAMDALIRGVEAASDEAQKDGFGRRIAMGFTFAYRLSPAGDAAFFTYLGRVGGAPFASALGFVGLDDYPGTVYPPAFPPGDDASDEAGKAIATMRDCYLPLAGIVPATPLWVTENGYSSSGSGDAAQAASLAQTIDEVRKLDATYGVTDYRYFNLRDNLSTGTGTFDRDGLLLDSYAPKAAYGTFASEIGAGP